MGGGGDINIENAMNDIVLTLEKLGEFMAFVASWAGVPTICIHARICECIQLERICKAPGRNAFIATQLSRRLHVYQPT